MNYIRHIQSSVRTNVRLFRLVIEIDTVDATSLRMQDAAGRYLVGS